MTVRHNLGEFTAQVTDYRRRVERGGKAWVLGIGLGMHDAIVRRTPIGDGVDHPAGQLRAAWLITTLQGGWSWEITNDKPYGPVVEFGLYPGVGPRTVATGDGIYSSQAPGGMVRVSLLELERIARRVEADLGL